MELFSATAKACKMRGAPSILPKAEDSVAPMIPAMTARPHMALSTMINWLVRSSSGAAMLAAM